MSVRKLETESALLVGGVALAIGLWWASRGVLALPVASFTITKDILTVNCDASATNDKFGDFSYDWDFGDGGTGVGKIVSHTYSSAGNYVVTLVVTNTKGSSSMINQSVTVNDIIIINEAPRYTVPSAPVKTFKVAIVIVENGRTTTAEDLVEIESRKIDAPPIFLESTYGFAALDMNFPTYYVSSVNTYDWLLDFYASGALPGFDFILFYTLNPIICGSSAYFVKLKNDIHGLGMPIYDNTGILPDRQLQGYAVSCTGIGAGFQEAMSPATITHELMHRWLIGWDYIQDGVLMIDHRHPRLPSSAYSVKVLTGISPVGTAGTPQGEYYWNYNGDGTFSVRRTPGNLEGNNDIDLYMMGFISKEQVRPLKIIVSDTPEDNLQAEWGVGDVLCPLIPSGSACNMIEGYLKYVTIDQIIAAVGERWEE